ncbi:MAG: M23 family metallopeptidase, partial [Oscillospiraceae bacterium]|nr:M23 family metallopeptidase [Oscillospiraceae bacterium]
KPTVTDKKPEVSTPSQSEEPAQTQPPAVPGANESSSEPVSVPATNDDGYRVPLKGSVMLEHSMDTLVYSATLGHWRVHPGMDILAEAGTPVMAASSGEVVSVYQDDALGNTVTISHSDGMSTVYANLSSEVCVQEGWAVAAGDVIGFVGTSALSESSDAPHLHFEMLCEGERIDPRDILAFE